MHRTASHQMNYEIIQDCLVPFDQSEARTQGNRPIRIQTFLRHALHYKCIGSRVCYCMQVTMTLECLLLFVFLFTVLMSHSLSWMIMCHKDSTWNHKIWNNFLIISIFKSSHDRDIHFHVLIGTFWIITF